MKHVCLLGDSIFDNGVYVDGGPDVAEQLEALPARESAEGGPPADETEQAPGSQGRSENSASGGLSVTLCAVDGSIVADVPAQIPDVPESATHLVLSAGGNDALSHESLLLDSSRRGPQLLTELSRAAAEFRAEYSRVLADLRRFDRKLAVCTIYHGNLEQNVAQAVPAAVAAFNDAIYRVANEYSASVIELRDLCTVPGDYANPIEPSVQGGAKIARAIADWVNSG